MEHDSADAPAILFALQDGWLGTMVRGSSFAYPLAEIIHILGFATLLGCILLVDLRVLGVARALPLPALARTLLPMAVAAFLVTIVMGFLLFSADAPHLYENPAFRAKMALIVVAGVNAAAFHLGPWRQIASWGERAPAAARTGAAISLAVWPATIAAGRLIAYF